MKFAYRLLIDRILTYKTLLYLIYTINLKMVNFALLDRFVSNFCSAKTCWCFVFECSVWTVFNCMCYFSFILISYSKWNLMRSNRVLNVFDCRHLEIGTRTFFYSEFKLIFNKLNLNYILLNEFRSLNEILTKIQVFKDFHPVPHL